MFLSLSKTIVRFGKMRLGLGIRITKKNVVFMGFILMIVYIFQACWYLLILCGWLIYAIIYGACLCIKKIIGMISEQMERDKGE